MTPGEHHEYLLRYDTSNPISYSAGTRSSLAHTAATAGFDLGTVMESLPLPRTDSSTENEENNTASSSSSSFSSDNSFSSSLTQTGASAAPENQIAPPPPHAPFAAPHGTALTRTGLTLIGDRDVCFAPLESPAVDTTTTPNSTAQSSSSIQTPADTQNNINSNTSSASVSNPLPRTGATLVVFVGGATYAEVAGVRVFAAQQRKRILVATTGITNGNRFMETLRDEIDNNLVWSPE